MNIYLVQTETEGDYGIGKVLSIKEGTIEDIRKMLRDNRNPRFFKIKEVGIKESAVRKPKQLSHGKEKDNKRYAK